MTASELQDQEKDNVLIIGDLLIDQTYYVDIVKISPEAPIPVAMKNSIHPVETPGGAGLGASFMGKEFLDTNVYFQTSTSKNIINKLKNNFYIKEVISKDISENDIVYKTRYIDNSSKYQILRVDNDNAVNKEAYKISREEHLENIKNLVEEKNIKGVVILDYCKGVLENFPCKEIIDFLEKKDIFIYVDSRSKRLDLYKGIEFLKLNLSEYRNACSFYKCKSGFELAKELEINNIIVTTGEDGATLFDTINNRCYNYLPDIEQYTGIPDVTGCGDVFDVTFCYHLFVQNNCKYAALVKAVNRATKFAYEQIESRLC